MAAVLEMRITVSDAGDVGLQAVGQTDPMLIVATLELAKAQFVARLVSPGEERRVVPASTIPFAPAGSNGKGGQ